jgi:hypothetical protein
LHKNSEVHKCVLQHLIDGAAIRLAHTRSKLAASSNLLGGGGSVTLPSIKGLNMGLRNFQWIFTGGGVKCALQKSFAACESVPPDFPVL